MRLPKYHRTATPLPTSAAPFALWIGGAWPPSSDKRLVQMRTGIRLRTDDYKAFIAMITATWRAMRHPSFGDNWLTCDLHFVRPDRRRRDAHNTIKALLDALQEAGAYDDDLKVNPRIESVRDVGDNPAHPLVPAGDRLGCLEPGVLVLLSMAPPMAQPTMHGPVKS